MDFQLDEELEKQYSPSQWALCGNPEYAIKNYEDTIRQGSLLVSSHIPCSCNVKYGETEAEKVNFYGDSVLPKDAPIFVFVHGGYWVYGSRQDSSYFVQPFYDSGIVCAVMGYDLINDAVTLPDIVSEIHRGLNFVLKYAKERGSRGVYLCGHSAGAHLITVALSLRSVPEDSTLHKYKNLIKGIIPISGIFDLSKLLNTSVARDAQITKKIAENFSPLKFVNNLNSSITPSTDVLIVVAVHDSPAFITQSLAYYEELKTYNIKASYFLVKNADHFSIVEKLVSHDFVLTKRIIDFIKEKKNEESV